MRNKQPTVTVGIPAYNEETNIENLVLEILDQKQSIFELEKVIVVSDGSTDGTVDKVKNIKNPLLKALNNSERKGKPYRLNQLIDKTKSDILVVLDADTFIKDKLFLEKLIKPIIKYEGDLTSAAVEELAPKTFIQKMLKASMDFKKFIFTGYREGNNLYTCHGRARAFSRSLYTSIHFGDTIADDAFSYFFCKANNFKYYFAQDVKVYYQLPKTFTDHEKQSIRFFQAKKDLGKVFAKELVQSEYQLPLALTLQSFLRSLIFNPLIIPYFAMAVVLNIKSYFAKQFNSKWSVAESSKIIRKAKISVCLFGTYDRNYTSNKLILQGLKENDIEVVEINAHTPVTRLDSPSEMTWIKLVGRIARKYRIVTEIIKNYKAFKKVDAIYVGYPGHFDVLIAYPIAKIFAKKLVFNPLLIFFTGFSEEQGILKKTSLLGKILKSGETLIYNLCDLVFADTPFQEKYLSKDFKVPQKKLRVLPIGADDKYYRYTPYKNLSKKINVVYYGLYSPIHGVEHVIEAARLLRNNKNIKFTFVGIGQTFKVNYERAQKLKLPNVEFFYDVPMEKHPAIIEKADIFLGFLQKHPTVDRVIPNKIYQGLALSKVVLTADVPVTRSIFTHKKNMYFCQPSDPKDLVKAVVDLQTNPKLRKEIADNGYALYKKEFTPKAVGKKLIEFVQEII